MNYEKPNSLPNKELKEIEEAEKQADEENKKECEELGLPFYKLSK